MDVTNQRLKVLLAKTDEAFRQLMKDPDSIELSQAYEAAKSELSHHISVMRESLSKKTMSNR